ncbi:MAG: hypothetical protein KJT03_14920 [Verrucomicrobiae bacterium]|nr:hypothetical protein [Verrucomicrobiae bacterium]
MRKPETGKCHLCLEDKELVESHIIPKFNFKSIKRGGDGFLHILSNDRPAKTQKELTEPLLCRDCDNLNFGVLETYLSKFLLHDAKIAWEKVDCQIRLSNIHYKKLKNALLSVLWRMHISSLEYFDAVDLGDEHSERIRRVLHEHTEFSCLEYPVTVTVPLIEGRFHNDAMINPDQIRRFKNRLYRFMICGVLFCITVGSHRMPKDYEKLILKEDGTLIAVQLDIKEIPFLYESYKNLQT